MFKPLYIYITTYIGKKVKVVMLSNINKIEIRQKNVLN